MRTQRGSVLVGVIAISLIMTVAAGGFLFVSANANKETRLTAANHALHYAAESGMLMAGQWIRSRSTGFHNNTWAETLVLTPDIGGYSSIDGYLVKVTIQGLQNGPPLRTVKSIATAGAGKDTLTLTWTVVRVDPDGARCIPIFSDWVETYTPGIP